MKTIASFEKAEQAHLLRSHLEGSGIAAFVRDEQTVTMDWRLSGAIGGVKVDVADENYEEACLLIQAVDPTKPRDIVEERKNRSKLKRYAKVFGISFVAIFAFLVWRLGFGARDIGMSLLCSFILSACLAVFGSLFES
jgi:hypothetical protein